MLARSAAGPNNTTVSGRMRSAEAQAAADAAPLDPWLAEVRGRIARSPEFRALSGRLYAEVRASLRAEESVPFGELSLEEQRVLVDRAKEALGSSEAYTACRDEAWRAVDAALDAEAEERLTRGGGAGGPSKAAAILDVAGTGASQLLGRWPTEARSLLWLLNTPLPPAIRAMAWRLKLRAPAARRAFEAKLERSRLAVVSMRDGAVLAGAHVAVQLADPGALGALPRLKACLSYADSLGALSQQAPAGASRPVSAAREGAADAEPPPPEYFWPIPLARVFGDDEPELVEHFLALLTLPKPLLDLPPPPPSRCADVDAVASAAAAVGAKGDGAPRVSALLAQADTALSAHLSKVLGGRLDALLLPHAQRLCVGLLSAEAVDAVWDLCLLTGWEHIQPALAAALICMRDGLVNCLGAVHVARYLDEHGCAVTAPQLRAALDRHFMAAVRARVGAPEPGGAPELSPN